jgi:hypothetical protein
VSLNCKIVLEEKIFFFFGMKWGGKIFAGLQGLTGIGIFLLRILGGFFGLEISDAEFGENCSLSRIAKFLVQI